MQPRVWFLNLDAELELANPQRAPRLEHGSFTRALIGTLVPPGDEIARTGRSYEGYRAMAWCPTAGVRALAESSGARFSRATPPPELIARVVARDWIARERGLALEGARFVEREEDLPSALAMASPTGKLLLRHRYGFAGKQRRICARGAPDPADVAFLRKALAQGGVLIEPWVRVLRDLGVHGYVGEVVSLGRLTTALVNPGGVWTASQLAHDSDPVGGAVGDDVVGAVTEEANACGAALQRAGYVGPFGLDGFVYDDAGTPKLAARCELNARYTMAWALGMGELRPDLTEDSGKKPQVIP